MKGERIFIPPQMRKEVLEKVHIGHQGIVKSQTYARSCIFWPGIDKDVENMTRSCTQCQAHQRRQSAEPLTNHELLQGPWMVVGADLFHFCNDQYLIIVDYFSKMPFVRKLPSVAVIRLTKSIFS